MTQHALCIHNIAQLVTCASSGEPKRGDALRDVGILHDGAVVIGTDGRIVAVGDSSTLRADYAVAQTWDAQDSVVLPAFVDCHTHLVYGGNRIDEFEQKLQGMSYLDILAQGGGILSTVRATRAENHATLLHHSTARLHQTRRNGTTTLELKSGYGLDTTTELRQLAVTEALAIQHPQLIVPTFLGAHAVPAEFRPHTDRYTEMVIKEMIPAVSDWFASSMFRSRGLPLFIDVFCEQNAFSVAQSRQILEAGIQYGMVVKAHVDEFNALGGLELALELGAVSVDHLDVTTPKGIEKLAQSSSIGVIMPAVNFHLGSSHYANARAMIDQGVAVALATDLNPGSAPCYSLPTVMQIACRYQKILPAEALNMSTIQGAFALGLGHEVGSIEVGKRADLVVLRPPQADYRYLVYEMGAQWIERVMIQGVWQA